MKLATAAEMAAVDRSAAERHGVAVHTLMERAGERVAQAAGLLLGTVRGRRVALFCGRGNNGGDGFVAARALREGGAIVLGVLVGDPEGLRDASLLAWNAARDAGVEFVACPDTGALRAAGLRASGADLVVDALLGTGFTPPARGIVAAAIGLVNSLALPVLAVDIPSGLDADNGRVAGEAVRATATVTFGYPKPGLVVNPGAGHVGRLWLADIGFPPETDVLVAGNLDGAAVRDLLLLVPPRDAESHKGSFGHLLLVAGSRGLAGAAALACRGALRAGVGLVTAALPASVTPPFLSGLPEAMLLQLPDDGRGAAGHDAAATVLENLGRARALALGPGLSRSAGSARLVRELLATAELPLVIDADALHALADAGPQALRRRQTTAVLTPHPGELAHLLGLGTADVQADRIGSARACAERFQAIVALKGSRTVVATPDGPVWINPTGNPAMAAGGMGDVLTGVIGAHLARGIRALEATLLGVYLHGLAGDLAFTAAGSWGILASEVADRLPAAVRSLGNRCDDSPDANLTLLVP